MTSTRPPGDFGFVIVRRIEIDSAKELQDAKLLAMLDVLRKSSCNRFFLSLVAACATGLFNQVIV